MISKVFSAVWSPASGQRRGFPRPFQVLPGSAGDAAWGPCRPITQKAITGCHHSSQRFAPFLPRFFLLFPPLPLSELLNLTTGAGFYSNSSLRELLMPCCFHSDINMRCQNAEYQRSVFAAGRLWVAAVAGEQETRTRPRWRDAAQAGEGPGLTGFPLPAISSPCLGMSLNMFIFQAFKTTFS